MTGEQRDHEEHVVLIDAHGRPSGTMPKSEVHGADTPLHLAFSVHVFNAAGDTLVTRRALSKQTWPGVWTNACCGHVRPGEAVIDAARRRLREELSLEVSALRMALPDFRYRATSAEGVVENEVCPVFLARADSDPVADPGEVSEWVWTDWRGLRSTAVQTPWALSPWAVSQLAQLPPDPVGEPARDETSHWRRQPFSSRD